MAVNVPDAHGAEMRKVVAANPYDRRGPDEGGGDVPRRRRPTPGRLAGARRRDVRARGSHREGDARSTSTCPNGQARSPLLEALGKKKAFGTTATSRNWRTVQALAEMSAG